MVINRICFNFVSVRRAMPIIDCHLHLIYIEISGLCGRNHRYLVVQSMFAVNYLVDKDIQYNPLLINFVITKFSFRVNFYFNSIFQPLHTEKKPKLFSVYSQMEQTLILGLE